MIEIKVKSIRIGAMYNEKTYNYWIIGQLNSKKQIKIFDLFGYDLKNYINHKVNCSIQATMLDNINKKININDPFVKGDFLQKISIPSNWIKLDKAIRDSNWYGVQNNDGIFYINTSELQDLNLKKGDTIEFNVGRFDLLAWNPIE